MLTATMGPPAETGRCTKRKVWQMLCFFAFLLPLLERLQLTVLALLLAPLSQRPTCEPASKCKQCVNEWSWTPVKRNERTLCLLPFWEGETCRTRWNWVTGRSAQQSWRERLGTRSILISQLDSELDSKPILMGDTQNHSVWLRLNNSLRYKYLFRKR